MRDLNGAAIAPTCQQLSLRPARSLPSCQPTPSSFPFPPTPYPQLPLGPSLPRFLLCFHAINLPFCVLNAARMAAKRAPGLASPQKQMLKSLSKGRPAAKLAWE